MWVQVTNHHGSGRITENRKWLSTVYKKILALARGISLSKSLEHGTWTFDGSRFKAQNTKQHTKHKAQKKKTKKKDKDKDKTQKPRKKNDEED